MNNATGEIPAAAQSGHHSVKWRLFWSFGAQALAIALRIAQQIALVPILIRGWGADIYADWIVVSSAAGLLSLLDFGIQIYFGNALLIARSKRDDAGYRRYFAVAMGVYSLILLTAGVVLLGGAAFIPWGDVLNTHA